MGTVDEVKVDGMIEDFIKRSGTRYTVSQIRETMAKCPTLVLDDGFLVLDIYQDECHVLYMYIRPGANLLPFFEFVAEDVARHYGCKVLRFISRRKPAAIMRMRPGYRPCAILYEKELRTDGRKSDTDFNG